MDTAPDKRKALYERFVETGKAERGEKAESTSEFVLAGLGAVKTARAESEKFFNELVTAGEERA